MKAASGVGIGSGVVLNWVWNGLVVPWWQWPPMPPEVCITLAGVVAGLLTDRQVVTVQAEPDVPNFPPGYWSVGPTERVLHPAHQDRAGGAASNDRPADPG